jgi:hypothetical protein
MFLFFTKKVLILNLGFQQKNHTQPVIQTNSEQLKHGKTKYCKTKAHTRNRNPTKRNTTQ